MPLTSSTLAEASLAVSLPPHPNLIDVVTFMRVADASPGSSLLMMVMELAPGQDLVHWVDTVPGGGKTCVGGGGKTCGRVDTVPAGTGRHGSIRCRVPRKGTPVGR